MAIEDRNLSVGTKLWAKYKGQVYTAEVVKKDGEIDSDAAHYRLADGREFKSPSAAGAAVMGPNRTCNGWAFWTVGDPSEGTGPVRSTRAPRAAVNAVPKPERKTRRGRNAGATQGEIANEEPSERTAETQAEGIECGQCGEVLPNAEAAAAHIEEAHSA